MHRLTAHYTQTMILYSNTLQLTKLNNAQVVYIVIGAHFSTSANSDQCLRIHRVMNKICISHCRLLTLSFMNS
jgi:hypothetical protein